VWLIFFITLSMVGSRKATPGPVWNPRSLSAVSPDTAAPHQKPSTADCRGETLADKGNAREKQ
jgi:hypothetical protein